MTNFSAANILKNYNLKATPQRIMILNEIHQAGHINMEHLYNHIHTILPSVSLATIYKNINSMTETGLLKEVALKGQKSHYEIDDEPHIHLICSQCGKIRDIHMTESELIKSVSNYTNEPVESVEITLYHTCTDCSA